jgi:hypothetical protein
MKMHLRTFTEAGSVVERYKKLSAFNWIAFGPDPFSRRHSPRRDRHIFPNSGENKGVRTLY